MALHSIAIDAVKQVKLDQWSGEVQWPGCTAVQKVLIFQFQDQLRAIDRFCPHQGYDLVGSEVSEGGIVKCQWHGLPFSLLDPKGSYLVEKTGDDFVLHYDDLP